MVDFICMATLVNNIETYTIFKHAHKYISTKLCTNLQVFKVGIIHSPMSMDSSRKTSNSLMAKEVFAKFWSVVLNHGCIKIILNKRFSIVEVL